MKQFLIAVFVVSLLSGCGEKHYVTVDRLEAMQKINVLYVAVAEPYRLGTTGGKTTLSRLVRGGAYYSIDLSSAKLSSSMVEIGESLTLTLKEPAVEAFPDPTRSVEFNPQTKLLVNDSGLNRIREMYDAKDREKIIQAATNSEYMKMAKEQAEKIIHGMLPELKVTIVWES